MCAKAGAGVGSRGVGGIETERQGTAGSTLLARRPLFVRGNKTVLIMTCVCMYTHPHICIGMQIKNGILKV